MQSFGWCPTLALLARLKSGMASKHFPVPAVCTLLTLHNSRARPPRERMAFGALLETHALSRACAVRACGSCLSSSESVSIAFSKIWVMLARSSAFVRSERPPI
eukprot:742683-Pleurochrysis_carterae.AAC.1